MRNLTLQHYFQRLVVKSLGPNFLQTPILITKLKGVIDLKRINSVTGKDKKLEIDEEE